MSPGFWLNLQKLYELRLAEVERGQEIRERVVPRAGVSADMDVA